MLWRLRTGAPWRDPPKRHGLWKTVYHRFNALRRTGLLDRMMDVLQARINAEGLIDADLWCVDGTVIRAAAGAVRAPKKVAGEPADHALGRSRGGFGTKVHLVCDGRGVPLSAVVTPGLAHESKSFEGLVSGVRLRGRRGRPRCRPVKLAGDKG